MSTYSEVASDKAERPNDVRPLVDETDRRILHVLAVEARLLNFALAERVGVAPSNCFYPVKGLVSVEVSPGDGWRSLTVALGGALAATVFG